MKSLIFTDVNKTINVEFITDLIDAAANNFTVMEVKNHASNDSKAVPALGFSQLPYNVPSFKAFATAHDYQLDLVDRQKVTGGVTNLVAISGIYDNGGLGLDNI